MKAHGLFLMRATHQKLLNGFMTNKVITTVRRNLAQTLIKLHQFFVSGDYELADELVFFTELSFHDGFVQGNQAPPGTDTGWYGDNIDTPNAFKRYPDAGR